MSESTRDTLALIARILLALLFIWSGWGKVGGFDGTVGYIGSKGLPMPQVLAAGTIAVELLGGIALLVGWQARWAALALAVVTLLAAFLFHNYWALPAEQKMMQQINFMKNLSVAGGMLAIAAFGAGGFSLDGRRRAPA